MKKIRLKNIWFVLLAVCMTGCEKSDIPYYNDKYDAVRFPAGQDYGEPAGYNTGTQIFYASYSFIDNIDAESFTYNLPVMLIGNISATDRFVSYAIDTEKSTAPKESYEVIESMIPANEKMGYIQIKLHNTEVLNEMTYELHITLNGYKNLGAGPKEFTKAYLTWDNKIPAPTNANHIRTYNMLIKGQANFISTSKNNYSPNALKVITNALGWNDWDDASVHGIQANNANFGFYKYLPRYSWIYTDNSYRAFAAKTGEYIKAYNKAHPDAPLLHDSGLDKGKPIEARSY